MLGKDLLSISDLSSQDIQSIVHRAHQISGGPVWPVLVGKTVALLFEKPSLRTKASFHVAVHQLGGYSFYMGPDEWGWEHGRRSPMWPASYLDTWTASSPGYFLTPAWRSLGNTRLCQLLTPSQIGAPCQILADLQTIHESKGTLEELKSFMWGTATTWLGAYAWRWPLWARISPSHRHRVTAWTRRPWSRRVRGRRNGIRMWLPLPPP